MPEVEELEALNKRRGTFKAAITETVNKAKRMIKADPAELNVDTIKIHIATLAGKFPSFEGVHLQIQEQHASSVNEEEQAAFLEEVENTVDDMTNELNNLLRVALTYGPLVSLSERLDNLQTVDAGTDIREVLKGHAETYKELVKTAAGTVLHVPTMHTLTKKLGKQLDTLTAALPSIHAGLITTVRPASTPISKSKLPEIKLGTYDGNLMKWKAFWTNFERQVDKNPALVDDQRLTYILQCLVGKAKIVGVQPTVYATFKATTIDKYDQPRFVHRKHTEEMMNCHVARMKLRMNLNVSVTCVETTSMK